MTLVLHDHPFAAYCWKVLIALEERGVRVERRLVGGPEDREALAQLWPMASIPVLVDGDLVLPESTTIVEHLDGFGDAAPLVPADPAAAREARLWDRIVDGHLMTPMQTIVGDSLRPEGRGDPEGVEQALVALHAIYGVLDDHLGDDGWLAGDAFTLADCAAAPALFYCRILRRWDEARQPRLTAYYERLRTRPSVDRVIEAARPYREVFPLPWPPYAD